MPHRTMNALFSLVLLGTILLAWGQSVPSCDSPIYCQGRLLDTVQRARLNRDSKTFVDMRMKKPSSEILQDFESMMKKTRQKPTKSQIQSFVNANFEEGNEIEDWMPEDYNSNPPFLKSIKDLVLRDFARQIVALWQILARRVRPEVIQHSDQYSLIPVPNGFIVPGGRFREFYYWDTYWIIKGLLISDMNQTARGMIENFFSMVSTNVSSILHHLFYIEFVIGRYKAIIFLLGRNL